MAVKALKGIGESNMIGTKKVLISAVLGLAGLIAIPAYAQYNHGWGWQGANGNYGRSSQNQAYQQGYRDGQWDTQHGPQRRSRNWSHDYDAQAYRDGYNAGYRGAYNGNNRDWDRDRDHDRDGRWGWNNNHGGYGGHAGNYSQQGFIDGQNDGTRDRQTGHSFRPTEQPGYKHADRGYTGGVSKDEYKQIYRQAYMQGYQRGYYQNGRR